ncbi:MAG: Fe-Mn family superoxide dismutase [Candidatus Nanoarchaeia archaeon]
MTYTPKNFDNLIGTKGFSEQLLKNHFTLYQGYVKNTNKILESLSTLIKEGKTLTLEFSELKRRFGWEFNGMRLHEYYFENMKKDGAEIDKNSDFFKKVVEDFGSFESWEKDFKSTGMMRGIGWVILYYDPIRGLFNAWINEHDLGHFSGCKPILVMDVFEHAYMLDYGLKREDYIEAFFKVIDWKVVVDRFNEVIG